MIRKSLSWMNPQQAWIPRNVSARNIISSFSKDRIILSTHIVSDVEYIADEILLMKKADSCSRGVWKILRSRFRAGMELVTDHAGAQRLNGLYAVSNLKIRR